MDLLTDKQREQLLRNAASEDENFNPIPVAKLVAAESGHVWLLTELDVDEPSVAIGLCDFGEGNLSYTRFDLQELGGLDETDGGPVRTDASFEPVHPIDVYIHAAKTHQRIVEDAALLNQAAAELRQEQIRQAQNAFVRHAGGICQRPPEGYELIAGTTAEGLLTSKQLKRLLENGAPETKGQDHAPIAKLLIPHYRCTWLLTELNAQNPQVAYGLCDKGDGWPRIGEVSLSYIAEFSEGLMWALARDKSFRGRHPISVYAQAAHTSKRITEDHARLLEAKDELCRQGEEQNLLEPEKGFVPN